MSRSGIAVVIPHFNRLRETRTCCESLRRQTLPPAAIVVVDNGSTAHTRQALAAACPEGVKLVGASRNLGFAGGCNLGIRQTLQQPGVEHVLLLNNDTECPEDLLARMAGVLEDPRVGLVGSPMMEGDRRRPVAAGKRLLWPFAIPVAAAPGAFPDYLSGACLLIRGEVLRELGLLDEGFFFFFEDADYSWRVKRAGWKLAVVDGTPLFHHGSSTIARLAELQAHTYRMGHIRYLRKHSALPLLSATLPFVGRLAQDLIARNTASLRGSWKGWAQAWAQPRPTLTHTIAPALSVIIPVFNAAPHIRECLDGILAQTWSDMEIICVDVDATDATRVILAENCDRDARIRVVNAGDQDAMSARDFGMQLAKGRYLWFMDGDKSCDSNLCATAVNHAETSNADIVRLDGKPLSGCVSEKENFAEEAEHKLFRAAFIRQHTICFPETR